AWALRRAGRPARLAFVVPECNSLGVAFLDGMDLDAAADAIDRGEADTVVILENDLLRRDGTRAASRLLEGADHVVVIDHLVTGAVEQADVVLPAATFAEGDGTLVNNEGRLQRSFQVFVPEGDVQESWRWVRDLARAAGIPHAPAWQTLDDV